MKSQIITASSSNFQHDSKKKKTSVARPPGLCWDTQSPWQRRIAACVQGPKGPMVSASLTWPAHLIGEGSWGGNAPQISGSLGDLDLLEAMMKYQKGKHKKREGPREALQYLCWSSSYHPAFNTLKTKWVWMSLLSSFCPGANKNQTYDHSVVQYRGTWDVRTPGKS